MSYPQYHAKPVNFEGELVDPSRTAATWGNRQDELLYHFDKSPEPHGIVRRPSQPSRWEAITYLERTYRYIPSPELSIEIGTIFFRELIPTSGKLYVDCLFQECRFDIPTAPYAVVGCVEGDGHTSLWRHAQKYGFATLLCNLIKRD
jgi:hypothetical protein